MTGNGCRRPGKDGVELPYNIIVIAFIMSRIKNIYKEQLSFLLGKGHAQFGKVAPRRPYPDEDEEGGGAGAAGLTLLEHPLLMNMPVGADPKLTSVTTENPDALDAAEERVNECCLELQQQPRLRKALTHGKHYIPTPTPRPL